MSPLPSRFSDRPLLWMAMLICSVIILYKCAKSDQRPVKKQKESSLIGLSVDELQEKLKGGDITSYDLTRYYLDRISEIDKQGPSLHAILETNPDALSIAYQMDLERSAGKVRGPLHGIPILLKDNIDTGDKMMTTAGSLALKGHRAKHDATIVKQLRDAGAILLGKTNMSEWANFRSSNSISGWSSRGGQTKNPYLLTSTPCGSSSGSAVAVAADLCPVSIGTSTDGSIACPASFGGVVGIRPTVGLVSRSGLIPISKSQDTAGPYGKTVRDATLLLNVMTSVDPFDRSTVTAKYKTIDDYTKFLDRDGLRGKRIGIDKSMLSEQEGIGKLLQEAIQLMQQRGATIVEIDLVDRYVAIASAEYELLQMEFKDGLNDYLADHDTPVKNLNELIEWNTVHAAEVLTLFDQDLLIKSAQQPDLSSKKYHTTKTQLAHFTKFMDSLMQSQNLDVIAGVGSGVYSPASVAGYPSITVPMGMANDVPVGITFVARPFQEPLMLAVAFAYEQLTRHRKTPQYLPAPKSS